MDSGHAQEKISPELEGHQIWTVPSNTVVIGSEKALKYCGYLSAKIAPEWVSVYGLLVENDLFVQSTAERKACPQRFPVDLRIAGSVNVIEAWMRIAFCIVSAKAVPSSTTPLRAGTMVVVSSVRIRLRLDVRAELSRINSPPESVREIPASSSVPVSVRQCLNVRETSLFGRTKYAQVNRGMSSCSRSAYLFPPSVSVSLGPLTSA